MSSADLLKEAERIMGICNACRYCEGSCDVFPAMELRRTFSAIDLKYLANLCHDCRGCYYACQYAPPHEFALNLPKTFSELRLETYREFTQPSFLSGRFFGNGFSIVCIMIICIFITVAMVFFSGGMSSFFSAHVGENAFYRVISYPLIVFPFSVLGIYVVLCLGRGMWSFWREVGGKPGGFVNLVAHRRAISSVLRLKNLDGGGHGCNYPDDRFGYVRKWCHHGVFYGFMLCFAATSIAAVYEHLLSWTAPYPMTSLPVLFGTLGGVALLIGAAGLLYLKFRAPDM